MQEGPGRGPWLDRQPHLEGAPVARSANEVSTTRQSELKTLQKQVSTRLDETSPPLLTRRAHTGELGTAMWSSSSTFPWFSCNSHGRG